MDFIIYIAIAIVIFVVVIGGIVVMITKFYRKVDQGKALIINKMKADPEVTFTGGTVIPVIHRAETMEISIKTIDLERRGSEGLICRDNIRADIRVTFFVRVNKTTEDVLKVAQAIGCARASDQNTLEQLFVAKFSEALKTVGKRLDFEQLYTQREHFKDQIIEVIGRDLNGYVLDDAAIDYLEQTPIESLDPQNILDSQGIRKITEITSIQNVETTKLKSDEAKQIGSEELSKKEALLNFKQREEEAEAKANNEITQARTREENKALRHKHEEQRLTMLAKQMADQEVAIGEQNKAREVEVAQKDREKTIAVESVRVQKARDTEEIERERDVEVRRIAKDKELEVEKKNIADVIRDRIAVEKNVAVEEEKIKDLRLLSDAKRQKDSRIIFAEAEAQEKLVKNIKAAEAAEEVAKHDSRRKVVEAEGDLESAQKSAQAKIRLSEGIQAESAAEGLALVRVKEAEATVVKKEGEAKADAVLRLMNAEAEGSEKKGLANIRVKEADVAVTERQGMVTAQITREQLSAEAEGNEKKGLAAARVKEADASALERIGTAEASAIKEKLSAEASGLAEKAAAMKALDGVGREHEEFRLRLEKDKAVELENIRVRKDVAEAQARVLSEAFSQAKINIVGGDGAFFDRFINAVSLGQSTDGFIDNSETARTLLKDYLDGDESLTSDLRDVLSRPAISSEAMQNLTVSAVLGRLLLNADDASKPKLRQLLSKARELGVDRLAMPTPPSDP